MNQGDTVYTPRFCTVTIKEVLSKEEAHEKGNTEPTHYDKNPDFNIYGKSIDINRMVFAAVKK